MDSGLLLYVPGAVLTLALLIKAPALRRDWHRPMMRAVCVLLLVGCLVLFLAAPPTIVAVNRLTGIPNCAAPLVYGVLTAFSGSCIVLVLHWSGTDPAAIRRGTRWTVSVTAAVTVLIVAAFAAGDAGVERVRDLDTYYANTPYVREMIVLYLLAHSAGSATLTVLSWKWLRRVRPAMRSLRGGLALLALGGLLDLGYLAAKWAAVGARWAGRDWDWLSTDLAPPLASGAAVLVGAGFLVPLMGASSAWREYSQYRALRPLCKALGGPAGPGAATVPLKWWSPVGIRLIHRESVINDAILALTPHCEAPVRARALHAALAQGLAPADAATVADAAMLAAAAARRTAARAAGATSPAGAAGPAGAAPLAGAMPPAGAAPSAGDTLPAGAAPLPAAGAPGTNLRAPIGHPAPPAGRKGTGPGAPHPAAPDANPARARDDGPGGGAEAGARTGGADTAQVPDAVAVEAPGDGPGGGAEARAYTGGADTAQVPGAVAVEALGDGPGGGAEARERTGPGGDIASVPDTGAVAARGDEAGPGADARQDAGPGVEARLGSRPLAALAAEFRRSPVVAAARREASRAPGGST